MKWKNAFFVAVAAFIATLSWAIKLNNEISLTALEENEASFKNKVLLAAMHDVPTINSPADCTCDPNSTSTDGLRTDYETAKLEINAYQTFLGQVFNQPNSIGNYKISIDNCFRSGVTGYSSLPPGADMAPDGMQYLHASAQIISSFKISHRCELVNIINNASENDEIYAFLALQPQMREGDTSWPPHSHSASQPDPTHPDLMLDLIFRVKSNNPSVAQDSDGYSYYDFTSPCPPLCDTTQCKLLPNSHADGEFCHH